MEGPHPPPPKKKGCKFTTRAEAKKTYVLAGQVGHAAAEDEAGDARVGQAAADGGLAQGLEGGVDVAPAGAVGGRRGAAQPRRQGDEDAAGRPAAAAAL